VRDLVVYSLEDDPAVDIEVVSKNCVKFTKFSIFSGEILVEDYNESLCVIEDCKEDEDFKNEIECDPIFIKKLNIPMS